MANKNEEEILEKAFSVDKARSVQKGDIIVLMEGGYTYIKVTDVGRSKTGKHGSAKAVITGVNLKTKKGYQSTIPQDQVTYKAAPNKESWSVIDIDVEEDCFYVEPNVRGGGEAIKLQGNTLADDDKVKIIEHFENKKDGEVVQLVTNSFPELVLMEDVKTVKL